MSEVAKKAFDVIVVGGGNAALCAALSAREQGSNVLLLERAPREERGGNSVYTDGLMRVVYEGADDIRALAPDLTDQEMSVSDFGSYTEENFFDDMARITQYRTDPDLCEILVKRSNATLLWTSKQTGSGHGYKREQQGVLDKILTVVVCPELVDCIFHFDL